MILALSTAILLSTASIIDSEISPADTLSLDETVVTALKVGRNVSDIPASINIATSSRARQGSSLTVADILKDFPGINKGGDGIWATSINIRGLGENRLVTLVDRCRIETATDLTASLSMFDVNDIERVEVISGAQSSIYGTGAIGGIINVVTSDGHFADVPYFSGNLSASFNSVNNAHSEYLSLQGGGKKWYVKANGSFSGASDVRTPQGILAGSGYKSSNASFSAAFKPASNQILKAQLQYNHSWDVGIPGGASFSPQATATYKNIDRLLASLGYELEDLSEQLDRLSFKVWYQGILRDVEMLPNAPQPQTGAMPTRVTPYATHRSFGANAESSWKFVSWNTLILGAEMWQRRINSTRCKYINQYAAGELASQMMRFELPLPRATYTSAGIFAQDEMRFFSDRLILSFGARADINVVRNGESHNVEYVQNLTSGAVNPSPAGKYVTFAPGSRVDPSWSANAGVLFKAGRNCDLVMNVSRSYRSPALEELYKFIDLTGNKIHFGNPDLRSEKGLGGDLGVRFHGEKLEFHVSGFINGIQDMIVERKVNVDESSVNDTLRLDNASRALLYGFDASISYEMVRGLKIYASGAWTIGRELPRQEESLWGWLPTIPPLGVRGGICYENPRILGADLSVTASGARKADCIALGERPTDAWYRLDFAIHSKVFNFGRCSLQLFSGVDNITDQTIVNFLSTNRGNIKCEAGRNFFIRARLTF